MIIYNNGFDLNVPKKLLLIVLKHLYEIMISESRKGVFLYLDDLPLYLDYIPDLYAVDTTVHYSSRYISGVYFKLNEDMKQIHKWCSKNDTKLKSMLIGSCRTLQTVDTHIAILPFFMIILY